MSALGVLDEISSALMGLVPEIPVKIRGEWQTTHRRVYESAQQMGSGVGPFVDVADMRWRGTIECSTPLTGIAFLSTTREISWAKAGRPAEHPTLEVSLHARANYVDGTATFASALMGSSGPCGLGASMDETDFEGTLVLEALAAVDKVDEFFEAIDSDDVALATKLVKRAGIDATTIAIVVKKMEESDGQH